MENNQILKSDDQILETPSATSEESDDCDSLVLSHLKRSERDLNTIQNKQVELDSIQRDLDDLMIRLNSFISDSQDSFSDNVSFDSMMLDDDDSCSSLEKQDGPSEKELRLSACYSKESSESKLYISDSFNPPEINWDTVGPVLQKHVADLQRLQSLNLMTNAVVKRIRDVTLHSEDVLEKTTEEFLDE